MAVFKDKLDREWAVNLNVGLVEDIEEKTSTNLDLMLENSEEFANFLRKSPRKLVEMLWVICEDQAKTYEVSPRDFGKLFEREILDRATDAIIEAIISFYPRASAGNALRKKLPEILAKMDQRIEAEATKSVEKVLSNTDTDSPESLG